MKSDMTGVMADTPNAACLPISATHTHTETIIPLQTRLGLVSHDAVIIV